jgi:TonB family protein
VRRGTPSQVTATDALRQPPMSEAMQRAVRQAGSPMRVILEAGRGTRKAADAAVAANAGAAPVALLPVRAVAALTPPSAAVDAAPRSGSPAELRAESRADLRAETAADESTAPIVAEITLGSVLQQAPQPAAAALAAIPLTPSLALPAARGGDAAAARPDLPQAQALAEPAAPPQIRLMVEPVLDARLLPEAQRLGKVVVDLWLQADGSVASAKVASPVPRALARQVLLAAQQWAFEPLAQAQAHRVELVYKPDS